MHDPKRQPYRIIAAAFLCIVLLLSLDACQEQPAEVAPPPSYTVDSDSLIVPVSDGRPVMTDGIFQPGEWDDAATLVINDTATVLFKQYRGHFYFALDSRKLLSPSLDLLLCANDTNIVQLHVSAQLAERNILLGTEISPDLRWVPGRTSDWYANEFRWIYALQDSLVRVEGMAWDEAIQQASFPHEAIECEVLRSKVGGNSWRFRMEVWTARNDDAGLVVPEGTSTLSLDGWPTLVLE